MTGEGETLLPVFASILSLSPEEVARCRQGADALTRSSSDVPLAAAAAAVDSAAGLLGGLSGSWASWLGGGTPSSANGSKT